MSLGKAEGILVSVSGARDLTLFEIDQAVELIREKVDRDANIVVGAIFEGSPEENVRVSVIATGSAQQRKSFRLQSGLLNRLFDHTWCTRDRDVEQRTRQRRGTLAGRSACFWAAMRNGAFGAP